MKKLLLFFTVAAVVAAMTGGDPPRTVREWHIKNSTEQTLKLKFLYHQFNNDDLRDYASFRIITISPEDSVMIEAVDFESRKRIHFDYYFNNYVDSYGDDAYWQILSEDDEVLKTWNYSERDLPGQRFFEESEWRRGRKIIDLAFYSSFVEAVYTWTFDIRPEDLQPIN